MPIEKANSIRGTALMGLMLLSLTGCKFERSFMNMDSNSRSPFFGLQWAVDSGSRAPRGEAGSHSQKPSTGRNRYPAIPDHGNSKSKSDVPVLLTGSAAATRNGFEPTSELRDLNTNVRYSLQAPVTDSSLNAQSVDLRLSAF
ncbi:MAG TPA: hypothetical protein PK992_13495 [Planctomycetaceae bacterium]|nr:hypothetical protein [Planctomycetaceae bacterium]